MREAAAGSDGRPSVGARVVGRSAADEAGAVRRLDGDWHLHPARYAPFFASAVVLATAFSGARPVRSLRVPPRPSRRSVALVAGRSPPPFGLWGVTQLAREAPSVASTSAASARCSCVKHALEKRIGPPAATPAVVDGEAVRVVPSVAYPGLVPFELVGDDFAVRDRRAFDVDERRSVCEPPGVPILDGGARRWCAIASRGRWRRARRRARRCLRSRSLPRRWPREIG